VEGAPQFERGCPRSTGVHPTATGLFRTPEGTIGPTSERYVRAHSPEEAGVLIGSKDGHESRGRSVGTVPVCAARSDGSRPALPDRGHDAGPVGHDSRLRRRRPDRDSRPDPQSPPRGPLNGPIAADRADARACSSRADQ
jgi:hypothetical protein